MAIATQQNTAIVKATQEFGPPLNADEMLYGVDGNWAIWIFTTKDGRIFGAQVGPKSLHTYDFPNAGRHTDAEFLTEDKYQEIIQRISQVKEIGKLRGSHGRAEKTFLGWLDQHGLV